MINNDKTEAYFYLTRQLLVTATSVKRTAVNDGMVFTM